jgi:hypothetical protein
MTSTLTAVADAIARGDYITANGEEPDTDEPVTLPPHYEIAAQVIGIVSNSTEQAETR